MSPADLLPALAFARDVARKATPGPLKREDWYVYDAHDLHVADHASGAGADLHVLAVNAFLPLLAVAEAGDRLHRAYLACCDEETACDADTDNFHGAAINLDAALSALQEVLDANAK